MTALFEIASPSTFDPLGYLLANDDLRRIVSTMSNVDERIHFATWHFAVHGGAEGRRQYCRSALERIQARRDAKLAWLRQRSPGLSAVSAPYPFDIVGVSMELIRADSAPSLPLPMDNISANPYDAVVESMFAAGPDQLFLDLGAGLRAEYRDNVVNVEVDCLATTDVLAFGDRLPFADGTFDGAVCLAVLEHVPDPFTVAAELIRVVRPGGRVIVDWPFLQPVHGYPDHYFNATMSGALETFRRLATVGDVEASVPVHFHPVFSLTWILHTWIAGLSDPVRAQFEALTVADLLRDPPHDLIADTPWVTELSADIQREISAGTRLSIVRR